jgi:hypothetical protein
MVPRDDIAAKGDTPRQDTCLGTRMNCPKDALPKYAPLTVDKLTESKVFEAYMFGKCDPIRKLVSKWLEVVTNVFINWYINYSVNNSHTTFIQGIFSFKPTLK